MALSISLLIVIIDSTVVNVALPTLQRELDASASELQWIVDAYILVFAALVLTTGSLSDHLSRFPSVRLRRARVRFGRSSTGHGKNHKRYQTNPPHFGS